MDLYDDLDDWCCAGDELPGKTPRKAWVIARIVAVPTGTQVGRLYPIKDESLSKHF